MIDTTSLGQKFGSVTDKILKRDSESSEIVINSLADLKKELKLSNLDTSSLKELEKSITFSRAELDKLQSDLLGTPIETLTKLKDIISKKVEAKAEASTKAEKLAGNIRENLGKAAATGSVLAVATAIGSELKDEASKLKDAKGLGFIDKLVGFFDKIMEKVDIAIEWFKGFFASKFPSIAKWMGMKSPEEYGVKGIADAAKKGGEAVADKGKEAIEKYKPSKEDIQKYKDSFTAKLEKQFNKNFSPEKKIKLHKLIDENVDNFNELKKGTFAIIDLPFKTGGLAIKFLLDLVKEDIIPVSAIAMNLVDTGINTVKIGISPIGKFLGMKDFDTIFGEFKIDAFGEMELSDTQKNILLGIIYRKGGLVTNLMGQAGYCLSSLLLSPLQMGENISALSMTGNTLIGNYEKVAKNYENMLKVLGQPPDGLPKMLQNVVKETKVKTEILAIYNTHGGDINKFKQEIGKLSGDSNFLTKVNNMLSSTSITKDSELGVALCNLVDTDSIKTQNSFEKFKGKMSVEIKGVFGNKNYIFDEFSLKMSKIDEGIKKSFQSGRTLLKYWANFKNSFKMLDVPKSFEKTVFAVTKENSKDFVQQLKFLTKQSPELVKGIFSNLPIIAVVGVAASSDESFIKEFGEGLKFMFPIVGPFLIMEQATLEEWKPHNMMNLAFGGGFFVYDIYAAGKVWKAAKSGEACYDFIKFMGRPVVDITRLGTGTLQTILTGSHGMKAILKLAQEGKTSEAFKQIKLGKIGRYGFILGLLLIAGWGIKEIFSKTPDEIVEALEKQGFINKDGGFVMDKIQEAYSTMQDIEKKAILTYMTKAILMANNPSELDNSGNTNPDRDFDIDIKSSNNIKITFKDFATLPERELIKSNLAQLNINVEFYYKENVLIEYAKKLKQENKSIEDYRIVMLAIGVNDPEKFWDKA